MDDYPYLSLRCIYQCGGPANNTEEKEVIGLEPGEILAPSLAWRRGPEGGCLPEIPGVYSLEINSNPDTFQGEISLNSLSREGVDDKMCQVVFPSGILRSSELWFSISAILVLVGTSISPQAFLVTLV